MKRPTISFLVTFVLTALVLFGLDFVWLGATTATLYKPAMAGMVRDQFAPLPGVMFYVIYAFALSYLVLWPGLFGVARKTWPALTFRAAVFGLACFATYDLTGLAVLKNWPLCLSLIDMAWGTFAAAVTATVITLALKGRDGKPA